MRVPPLFPCVLPRALRRPALALLAVGGLAFLGGCGGGPAAELADVAACVVSNCKYSADVAPQDLRLGGTLTREDGRVSAQFDLSYRANLFTSVRLSSPDALWLMPGQVSLTSKTGPDGALEAQFTSNQDSWTVRLSHRGQTYDSVAVLPAPVQIRAPAPSTLVRSQAEFSTTLAGPGGVVPEVRLAEGDCQLADGRSARWTGYKSGPRARLASSSGEQSQYTVTLDTLQQSLDEAAASALSLSSTNGISVKLCRFGLVWAYKAKGTMASGLSTYGAIYGVSQVRQAVSYLNDR